MFRLGLIVEGSFRVAPLFFDESIKISDEKNPNDNICHVLLRLHGLSLQCN